MAGQSTRMLVDTYEELSYLSAFVESLPILAGVESYEQAHMEGLKVRLQSIIYDVIQPIEDMLDSNGWDTEQLKKNGLEKTRTN
jgi:hypothetical protein